MANQERGENCIEGMRCPECGNYERFNIVGLSTFATCSDGTDHHNDVEWDDDSHCSCSNCQKAGIVSDFKQKRFTVIGRLHETDEVEICHVQADDAKGAEAAFVQELAEIYDCTVKNIKSRCYDLHAIFEGHLNPIHVNETTSV